MSGFGAASILVFGGRVARSIASMLVMMILSRFLDRAEFGRFATLWSTCLLLLPFLDLGLSSSISTSLATHAPNRRHAVARSVLLLSLGVLSAFGLVGCLIGTNLTQLSSFHSEIPVVALFLVLSSTAACLEGVFLGLERPKAASALFVVDGVLRISCTLIAVGHSPSTQSAWTGLGVAAIGTAIFAAYLLRQGPEAGSRQWAFPEARDALRFGVLLVGAAGIFAIARQLDRLFVAATLGNEAMAVYTNGCFDNPIVSLISGSIITSAMPLLANAFADSNPGLVERALREIGRLAARLIAPLIIGSWIFAEEVITVLFSTRYLESTELFRLYLLFVPLRCLYLGPILVAAKQSRAIISVGIVTLLSTAMLVPLLTSYLGLIGTVIAGGLAMLIPIAFTSVLLKRRLQLRPNSFLPVVAWSRSLTISIVLGAGISAVPFATGIPRLLVLGSLFALAYVLVDRFLEGDFLHMAWHTSGASLRSESTATEP